VVRCGVLWLGAGVGDDSSGSSSSSSKKLKLSELGSYYCQGIQRSQETGAGSTGSTGSSLGASYGHGGGTLGFSSRMLWLTGHDDTNDDTNDDDDDNEDEEDDNDVDDDDDDVDVDVDCVVACMTNVGGMHSGLGGMSSPFGVFTNSVLLPAVQQYLGIGNRSGHVGPKMKNKDDTTTTSSSSSRPKL
jgi:hypothetical protein